MKKINEYISILREQKQELSDALNNKGVASSVKEPLEALIDKVEQIQDYELHALDFVIGAGAENISISLVGHDDQEVTLHEEGGAEWVIALKKDQVVTYNFIETAQQEDRAFYFTTVDEIKELDLRDSRLKSFQANKINNIEKLVLCDNELNSLNCSHFTSLQFLHIHNNPFCSEEASIINTISTLPSRKEKATGSIIFYPWFGLETLIELNEGEYYKYPYLPDNTGNYNNVNSMHYPWNYDDEGNYKFEDGRLYGIVIAGNNGTRDVISERRVYSGSRLLTAEETDGLEEYKNINKYHGLRTNTLEKISLQKNWVFGSAIMYNDTEWAKCPWDFRQNHIADMWETSEKGFGYTIGICDSITLLFPGAQDLNIVSYENNLVGDNRNDETKQYSKESPNYLSKTYTNAYYFDKGKITHGDNILGILCGNGAAERMGGRNNPLEESRRYGDAPLAKIVIVDKTAPDSGGMIPGTEEDPKYIPANDALEYIKATDTESEAYKKAYYLVNAKPPFCLKYLSTLKANEVFTCDTLTISLGSPSRTKTEKEVFDEFGPKWRKYYNDYASQNIFIVPAGNSGDGIETTSEEDSWYDAFYGHNNKDYKYEGELPCQVLYSHALDQNNEPGSFSRSSPYSKRSKLTAIDFYADYGANVLTESNKFVLDGTAYFKRSSGSGTSYSTPSLCGNLLLLRIIYSKLPDAILTSFGKFSPYMDYVRDHWCDIIEKEPDMAIGYGKPDILAKPSARRFITKNATPGDKSGVELIADIGEYVQDLNEEVYQIRENPIVAPALASKNNLLVGTIKDDFSRVDYSQYLTFPLTLQDGNDYSESGLAKDYNMNGLNNSTTLAINGPSTLTFAVDFVPATWRNVTSAGFSIFKLKFGTGNNNHYEMRTTQQKIKNGAFTEIERIMLYLTEDGGEYGPISRGTVAGVPYLHNFLKNYTKIVFSITLDENEMAVYLNGKRIIRFDKDIYYSMPNAFLLPQVANETPVYWWDRVLTQKEIIQNSAALLNE